ncbi:MAG: MBL fold metallo-hydrolase [Actinobacteria bacterium]|nr:MAG: MBL fold metallo-hydrolase [Actinomycetota bacterium]
MLVDSIPLWLVETNAWIVAPAGPGGECVLVDAPPDPAAILARLAHHQLRVVAILATHGHVDHVGGIPTVVRDPSHGGAGEAIPVHLHDGDRHMILHPVQTGGALGQALGESGLDVRPPELIHGLDDGQRVSGASMTFTALHTPGHTKGSTCFLLEVEGEAPVLFSGDHLFRGAIGRTDLPGGSMAELMASMEDKILPLPDHVRVYPGHGAVTTIGRERLRNPFLARFRERLSP